LVLGEVMMDKKTAKNMSPQRRRGLSECNYTRVDRLKVDGEDTSALSLNTCVVITQSFEKNVDNGGQ
jgi:hypothetical protein